MSDTTNRNAETRGLLPQSYLQEGREWERDVYRRAKTSRNIAWMITAGASAVAVLSLTCLAMLIPLKQFEPYVVAVDKTTGYLEIVRGLNAERLPESEREAVMAASIVRYLRARETYDAGDVKSNFELAMLLSTGEAARTLAEEFAPANPRNLLKLYGRTTTVTVNVKSLSFLNTSTAQVRFSTIRKNDQTTVTEHWVAVLRFKTTSAPMRNEWRWDNPLGFQVDDYRRDQETVSGSGSQS